MDDQFQRLTDTHPTDTSDTTLVITVWDRVRRLFAPPVFEGDEAKTRAAKLLNGMLIAVIFAGLATSIMVLRLYGLVGVREEFLSFSMFVAVPVIGLGLLILARLGHLRSASICFVILIWVASTVSVYGYGGLNSVNVVAYFVATIIAAVLLGGRAGFLVALISLLSGAVIFYAEATGMVVYLQLEYETVSLVVFAMSLILAAFSLHYAMNTLKGTLDRLSLNERALAETNRELKASRDVLRIRTQELEQRSASLSATAEVGRAAGAILEPDELIRQVVELIREQFGLYYVGLFIVDEAGEWAVLQAGTGSAGQTMLARGHRIRVGEGMIGWSVAQGRSRVALEAGADAVRLATPELPETRSEAALPLHSRGRVLGALSVQHTQAGAFDETTIAVLQAMADQVGVALDNARLFVQSQAALEATRRAYGQISRDSWSELLGARGGTGYRYANETVTPVVGEWRPQMIQAARRAEIVQAAGEGIAIPLTVHDQVIGVLNFRRPGGEEWSTSEVALLQTITDQLGLALDSARIYQGTRQRAVREQIMAEITGRIRETLDPETIVKTAAYEIGQALDLRDLTIHLALADGQTGWEKEVSS